MQVFEFHFNPKAKNDLLLDSFCYEPADMYEKRLGSLYMAGFLKNALPQNSKFLDDIAKTIKDKYYAEKTANPEKSLREALRKANDSLEKIAREGDVNWLGNLSFAVLSVKPSNDDWEINFTKVGDLRIFLIRKGQIIDIDQKLKYEDIEPYPLKIFGNIISGRLLDDDLILILTKENADYFSEEGIFNEIEQLSLPLAPNERPKKIRNIFNGKKEKLSKTIGVCLLIVLTKEVLAKSKETIGLSKVKEFSFRKALAPLSKLFSSIEVYPKGIIKKLKIDFHFPKIKLEKPKLKLGQQTILVGVLVLILVFGFFFYKMQEQKQIKAFQEQLNQIEAEVSRAESYLNVTNPDKKTANSILKKTWNEISGLTKTKTSITAQFTTQTDDLKNKIYQDLAQINQLTDIADPETIFDFKANEFIPQKMVYFKKNLYFFSPLTNNVVEIDQNKQSKTLTIDKKIDFGAPLSSYVLFFSKPNQLTGLRNDKFDASFELDNSLNYNFSDLSGYQSNLYFLTADNEVIKYPFINGFQWDKPKVWFKNQKATDYKSMAVDSSVWLLTKDNVIEDYYAGNFQKSLILDIFPELENVSKIYTNSQLSYLYLLEPSQKRIIIIDKSGKIIKQFQSQKFDSLLDFSVSDDGQTIWLLNGLKLYQIKL